MGVFLLPEKDMIGAILHRTFLDLTINIYRKDAFKWICSKNEEPFSFYWCCTSLNLNPDEVRVAMIESTTNGITDSQRSFR